MIPNGATLESDEETLTPLPALPLRREKGRYGRAWPGALAGVAMNPDRRIPRIGLIAWPIAAALVAVSVVAFYVATANGGNGRAGPERVVQRFYETLTRSEAAAEVFIETEASANARQVAFANTPFAPGDGSPVRITGLTTKRINTEAGWASVRASGRVKDSIGGEQAFDETIFLRDDGLRWLISTEARFVAAFAGPQPTAAPRRAGIGPLVSARPEVGQPAPDFALVDARDGQTVRTLSDLKGKAVVINWYASWCGPCKRELPEFQAASEALTAEVVFLAVDFKESRSKALSILDERKVTYPALLDSDGSVAEHYRVDNIVPSTFFVDRDGVLRAFKVGQLSREELVEFLAKAGVTYVPK